MKIVNIKTGMKVKANDASNQQYMLTNKNNNCVIEVFYIDYKSDTFSGKILACDDRGVVGHVFSGLNPECFDNDESLREYAIDEQKILDFEVIGVPVGINKVFDKVNTSLQIEVGDVVVLGNGHTMAIINDHNGFDYRGFIFETFKITEIFDYIDELQEYIDCEYGGIVKHIDKNRVVFKEIQ